ncbi:MAG: phosphatase PAP2 family protein [Verrucomicrobia bacterium]|nr:phosphatase PAP2 family protein [Verrucomicrobiota bacterium]
MLCYFPPQVWPVREPTAMASSFLPFYPGWSVIYQSVFLLHTAAIWCVPSARASLHYVREVSLAFAMAAVVFWIWPTHVIRPDDAPWFYEWLIVRVDGPGNAFPSMHAAMGLLGVLHLGAAWPRARPALFIWLGFMLVSTLLTRQHVWQDLIAGLVLALTIHLLNKHRRP